MAVTCNPKVPRWPIAAINVLFALALATIGFGTCIAAGYWNQDRLFNSPGSLRTTLGDPVFVAMMIVGLTTIVMSILGCSLWKIESRVLPGCYGAFIIPMWIIYVALAASVAKILSTTTTDGLQQFCDSTKSQNAAVNYLFKDYVNNIDTIFVPAAQKWMCSKQCPCDSAFQKPWANLTAAEILKAGRTNVTSDINDADGTVLLNFTSSNTTNIDVYGAFADCFYEWKTDFLAAGSKPGVVPDGWVKEAETDFENINSQFDSVDLLEYLQFSQGCNGICKQGIFAFSANLADGVPNLRCDVAIAGNFADVGPFVYAWLAAGAVITFFTWIAHLFLLCFIYRKRDAYQKVPTPAVV